MMGFIGTAFMFANVYAQSERGIKKWQEEIKAEWRNSRYYPRKKKKRVRKSLELDWQIATFNPLDGLC